jgi:ketosteroid isomerase-like protein
MTRYAAERDHPSMTDTADANRRLIRTVFEGWQAGTASVVDLFAPAMVWRIEGHSEVCGEYATAQDFIDQVLAPFGARFARGERFRPISIRSILADGDTVVVIWDGRGICNDGVPYENSYAWILQLRDGKVIDGTAFFDSISLNNLWQRVTPAATR